MKVFNRKYWEKGGGEFIGFAITCVFMIFLLSTVISIFLYGYTMTYANNTVTTISRQLTVQPTLKKARKKAKEELNEAWNLYSTIDADQSSFSLDYSPGAVSTEWKKGNMLDFVVNININTPLISGNKTIRNSLMIENSGTDIDDDD